MELFTTFKKVQKNVKMLGFCLKGLKLNIKTKLSKKNNQIHLPSITSKSTVILCNCTPNALANSRNCSRIRLSWIFFIVWIKIKTVLFLVEAFFRRAIAFCARIGNGANVVVDGPSISGVDLSVLNVLTWRFVDGIAVVVETFLSPYQVVRGYRSDNIRINDDNAVDSCIGATVDSTETWLIFSLNNCSLLLLMDDGFGSVLRLSDRNSLVKHGVNNSKLNITTKITLCFCLIIIWQANDVDSTTDENIPGKHFIREEATTRGPQETLITRFFALFFRFAKHKFQFLSISCVGVCVCFIWPSLIFVLNSFPVLICYKNSFCASVSDAATVIVALSICWR